MELLWCVFKAIYSRWGTKLNGKYDKLCAYGALVILVFFSILDTLYDWQNYKDLTKSDYKYSIATGPPDPTSVEALLVFTVIGTLLCIGEIFNAFSLMCNGGHTKVDIEVEQLVTMVACQIPQASINMAICLCRNNHLTNHQSVSLLMSLINVTLRLYIYGCAKERLFPIERPGAKKTLKMALYVTASVVYICMCMTQVFIWDHGRVTKGHFLRQYAKQDVMKGVSISLVRLATHTEPLTNRDYPYNSPWGNAKKIQPWLVQNITDIYTSRSGIVKYYRCNTSADIFEPPSCNKYNASIVLKFRFFYHSHPAHFHINPLGEILFNYGLLVNNIEVDNRTFCEPSTGNLENGWHLKYYRFQIINNRWIGPSTIGKKAWEYVCSTPRIRYDADIDVC